MNKKKKLLTVTVEYEFVIVCDDDADEKEQYRIAGEESREAFLDLGHHNLDFFICDYERHKPNGWDDLCIPYGGDGNTRTNEYLKAREQ